MARRKYNKTRRANNEGSIYQRSDGLWTGMATLGYDENGKIKRKAVYGKTKLEVSKKLTDLTNRISNQNYEIVENSNFDSLMREWLLIFKKSVVTPRTFEGNFRNFELHISPQIGNMKLDEITNITLQKLFNDMLDDGYSLAVVKKIKHLLNQFFEYAIENKLTITNPVTRTKVKSNEKKIYDSENVYKAIPQDIRHKFIECLENNQFLKPLCLTMMFAGLRAGEVLALSWNNIDFENKTLKVEKAITQVPKFDSNGKIIERKTVISTTKTICSVREIPMPDILINALKEYKLIREQDSLTYNINLIEPTMLVFGNNDGSVRTYHGTKCIFERFLKKYNLNKYGIHFHGLRHTYSNTLFEANQNPKVIQGLLGHKSVKTTITTYNSVDKSYFQKATDIFNKEYSNDNKTNSNIEMQKQEPALNSNPIKKPIVEEEYKRPTLEDIDKLIEQLQYEREELKKEEKRKRQRDYEMEM